MKQLRFIIIAILFGCNSQQCNVEVDKKLDSNSILSMQDTLKNDIKMFGNSELQEIGLQNEFDMVLFENGKNILLLVRGKNKIKNIPNASKESWIKANIKGANIDLLSSTDTIEYCEDLSGNDCKYYIFKNGRLSKILNAQ